MRRRAFLKALVGTSVANPVLRARPIVNAAVGGAEGARVAAAFVALSRGFQRTPYASVVTAVEASA